MTGAAGGIGGALVRALVERGARSVVATDLDGRGVEDLSEELGTGQVVPRILDVSDEAATRAFVDEVQGAIGPIDVFFANAGISTGGGPETADELWVRQWRVNVMSHVYAARALLPGWIERGEGHLVTTASMAGLLSALGDAAYSATKHAAVGFAEWLAFTYAGRGVRVSCICPGAVDTAMLRAGSGGDAAKASAAIGGGGVIAAERAADRILDGLAQDRRHRLFQLSSGAALLDDRAHLQGHRVLLARGDVRLRRAGPNRQLVADGGVQRQPGRRGKRCEHRTVGPGEALRTRGLRDPADDPAAGAEHRVDRQVEQIALTQIECDALRLRPRACYVEQARGGVDPDHPCAAAGRQQCRVTGAASQVDDVIA